MMKRITVDNLELYSVYDDEHKGAPELDGVEREYRFPNGFGGSVVRFKVGDRYGSYRYGSYTNDDTEWELAVIRQGSDGDDHWPLTYDTPITDDVIGHLQEEQVKETLLKIAHLKAADDGAVIATKTMVIFRVWNIGLETIALFPCRQDGSRTDAFSYASGSFWVNYAREMKNSRPATPEEAMPLADELKGLGYSLSVRQRAPSAAYREKWKAMGND